MPWDDEDVLDLSDEMNIGPLIVLPNTPASRIYHLFSAMGLRHLPVVSSNGGVVGMITRHDLHHFQRLIDSRHGDRGERSAERNAGTPGANNANSAPRSRKRGD